MLRKTFTELIGHYTLDKALINKFWNEVEANYSKKNRYYHTLQHLDNLLEQLNEIKVEIKDQHAVLFALYYHDIIYDPLRHNNEDKSAALAEKRLKQIPVPETIIEHSKTIILATKNHLLSGDNDTNIFTDADLSILGSGWNEYLVYSKQIREEYSIYTDLVYYAGRRKVLQHFLDMERIFKTNYFFERLEAKARQNLQMEFGQLK